MSFANLGGAYDAICWLHRKQHAFLGKAIQSGAGRKDSLQQLTGRVRAAGGVASGWRRRAMCSRRSRERAFKNENRQMPVVTLLDNVKECFGT
jgi:hypothetical protein